MELDVREALRYLGVRGEPDGALLAEAGDVARALTAAVTPRYTYRVLDLERTGEGFALPGVSILLPGALAEKMLAGCQQAALLACTLGAEFDRLLAQTQARDMARAALLDAYGSAWVEAGCDKAQEELLARLPGRWLTDRFSPGYGDLPLALQRDLCAALDASRRLGLTVTGSLMLNPVKSVTAILGLADTPQPARIRGCSHCKLRENCTFRREGEHCGA